VSERLDRKGEAGDGVKPGNFGMGKSVASVLSDALVMGCGVFRGVGAVILEYDSIISYQYQHCASYRTLPYSYVGLRRGVGVEKGAFRIGGALLGRRRYLYGGGSLRAWYDNYDRKSVYNTAGWECGE